MNDTGENRPFSEIYAQAGEEWATLEAAAQILEDTKSSVMAQKQAELGPIPVNKAEQTIKASPFWVGHIHKIVEARKQANIAKVNLDVVKMRYYENANKEANGRVEMRMMS